MEFHWFIIDYLYVICAGKPSETDTIKAMSKFKANMFCKEKPRSKFQNNLTYNLK